MKKELACFLTLDGCSKVMEYDIDKEFCEEMFMTWDARLAKSWKIVDEHISFEKQVQRRIFRRTLNLMSGMPLYIETSL